MTDVTTNWAELRATFGEVETLEGIQGALIWDQRTAMPAMSNIKNARRSGVESAVANGPSVERPMK